jgi:AmmeMemoRadiSam system protein A
METEPLLKAEERQWLLRLARKTLESLEPSGSRVPDEVQLVEGEIPMAVQAERGAFVTLHAGDDLRGCIGYVLPVAPLYRSVIENTVNAARRDPRFLPVTPGEVAGLRIEVSAMTLPHKIDGVADIRVGEHGLIVSRGGRKGLLLPQVATEYGWDAATFLSHTCQKAGLPFDAWQTGPVEIEVFTAEVFSE